MFRYLQFGRVPPRRHIAHYEGSKLLHEYCFTREGFDEPYSILYLHHPPTDETSSEACETPAWANPTKRKNTVLRRRHFKGTSLPPAGDFISGRTALAFNDSLAYGICRPLKPVDTFFANNDADELFFLFEGEVEMQSMFGKIRLTAEDYLIIPRSCPYRFNFSRSPVFLHVEAKQGIGLPRQYFNPQGQLNMDAPYSERGFKIPEWDRSLFEGDEAVTIIRKRQDSFTRTGYGNNYFKMSGWDGYVYPLAINLQDIQPKTGRVHLPPSSHLTFSGKGFAVMSFLPRPLDFDKDAIPCPFYHSSVNCDELLFYVSGNFTSRKLIGKGSISYHPSGIPHGPHPGNYRGSIGLKHTDEKAVMIDTFGPLLLTEVSEALEDRDYPASWRENPS